MRQFMPVNGVILLAVLTGLSAVQYFMHCVLAGQQMFIQPLLSWVTLVAMALLLVMIWITNRATVKKYLQQ
jgi:hypothetical protein